MRPAVPRDVWHRRERYETSTPGAREWAGAPGIGPSPEGPARRGGAVQVKYTDRERPSSGRSKGKYDFRIRWEGARRTSRVARAAALGRPALTGSDQAREGRLVDALAARGDEGRDTLR